MFLRKEVLISTGWFWSCSSSDVFLIFCFGFHIIFTAGRGAQAVGLAVLEGLLVAGGVVVAKGALEGGVADALAAVADLFAVELLVGGGGEDLGLAGRVDAASLGAGGVAKDTGGGRGGVGGGERGGVAGAATATTVVEETTAATTGIEETTTTAAPLSGFLGLFFKVSGFGKTAGVSAARSNRSTFGAEGVDRTVSVARGATAAGGKFVGAVVGICGPT